MDPRHPPYAENQFERRAGLMYRLQLARLCVLEAIKAWEAEISNVRAELIGPLADSPARFAAVELCVIADGAKRDQLERLVEIEDRAS